MKKLSLVVATMLASQSTVIADDIKNEWTLNGNIRAAYISDNSNAKGSEGDEIHDLAVGGSINILTPKIDNNFQVGATLYTAQPLFGQNTNGWLTENNDEHSSYSYIGEAYITGTLFGKTSVILGKKVIDTPFANPDDIGMTPNSFEVYLVQNNDIENVTLTAGRVLKMAGQDAPTRKGEFGDLIDGGDGVSVMAVNYSNSDLGLDAQAWYYHLDKFVGIANIGIAYADATYSTEIDEKTSLAVSGQFVRYQQNSGDKDDGSVIGGNAELSYEALTLGIAFNQSNGDISPHNGFGGGPFYTSADIMTIVEAGKDASALRFTAGYNLNQQISFSGGYATFTPDGDKDDFSEVDFSATYLYNNSLTFDLYVENWTNEENVKTFEYSLFMNYSF